MGLELTSGSFVGPVSTKKNMEAATGMARRITNGAVRSACGTLRHNDTRI